MTAVVNVVTTIVIDGLFIYWCQIFADVVGFFTKAITSTGTKKGELFFGDVSTQVKNNNVTADIKVDTGSNVPSQGENVTDTSPQAGAPDLLTSRSRIQFELQNILARLLLLPRKVGQLLPHKDNGRPFVSA
ncbi:uncharacterized protein LOC110720100 isoform X2 [Chenopodium quinoa]|uniref:uncharacterized protein LOC110720100 isoform X2 n=1 Tax=Chenopodium quinoa TaxID=63459 RepID=UPI000B77D488|nr:uncharacterized protein LOC110720100 isoform X2 [Chenopodium quinoa]